ncbi:hypothetical protein [Streptomyces sp. NPDC053079]|uniref:hypothetical protein n=1 Tax=Streptomyces sp. NPDC053079 TaxID=3365697 RepID=UPI0037D2D115
MENTGTASVSAPGRRPGHRPRRTAADWVGLAVLAVAVLVAGAFVGVLGPLFAIACDSCQDGIRGPLRFGDELMAVAANAVPLATLATVAGIFHPRGGARAGGIGLGALTLLLVVMLSLGRFTA